jgi:hypothetical protein
MVPDTVFIDEASLGLAPVSRELSVFHFLQRMLLASW